MTTVLLYEHICDTPVRFRCVCIIVWLPFSMNYTQHITLAEPLYLKHSELMHLTGNIVLQLSRTADKIRPSCSAGAQTIRGVWYYVYTMT